jgi:hypothetical protein
MRCYSVVAVALLASSSFVLAQEIPAGTVIPIMLTMTVESNKAHPGQQITGKVMESVPLAEGNIPAGAKVFGHVDQVHPGDGVSPSWIAIQFDHIVFHQRELAFKANLRALASMMAVQDAQVPFFEPDTTPRSAIMLAPVGGDAAFRPDNPEKSWGRMVRFSGDLNPGCGGRVDQPGTTGALWVFSPYACGLYGFGKGLVIVYDGSANPVGNIVLGSQKNVVVHAGSGMLLRTEAENPLLDNASVQ